MRTWTVVRVDPDPGILRQGHFELARCGYHFQRCLRSDAGDLLKSVCLG